MRCDTRDHAYPLVIKYVPVEGFQPQRCALCDGRTRGYPGPHLVNDGTDERVCWSCGEKVAPKLTRVLVTWDEVQEEAFEEAEEGYMAMLERGTYRRYGVGMPS